MIPKNAITEWGEFAPWKEEVQEALSFLGEPKVKQKRNNNTLIFRVQSNGVTPLPIHLKVEINRKEHFSVLPLVRKPFEVNSIVV